MKLNTNPKTESELLEYIENLYKKADSLGVKVDLTRNCIHDVSHLDCVWYGGDIGSISYKGYAIIISARGDIRLNGNVDGVEINFKDKNNGGTAYQELKYILDDKKLQKGERDGSLEFESNNWFEVDLIAPDGTFIDLCFADNVLDDNILECFANFEDYFEYVDNEIEEANKNPIKPKAFVSPKTEEELLECFDELGRKAKALGVELCFEREDVIDADHLDRIWYRGEIGEIVYKGYVVCVDASGSVVLTGEVDGEKIEISNCNSNTVYAFVGQKYTDEQLKKLLDDGAISDKLSNWTEVKMYDADGKEVDVRDGVLENNVLECFYDLERLISYVDIEIERRAEEPDVEEEPEKPCEKAVTPSEVYAVITTWSTHDDGYDADVSLYATPDKANKEFERCVRLERENGEAYCDGELRDGYEEEITEDYFEVSLTSFAPDYNTVIRIEKMPVHW